ncbi:MAG: glycosyltransferase, partial [Proteobacteria bacterium]|nr:glycosyltransferase [Pseudomonadota bacterium]
MEVLVVIPTYNESNNIRPLSEALLGLKLDLGILIVDDNSPDGTGRIADSLAKENSRVHVLHRPGKQGLGTAYREGFGYAL